MKGMEQRILKRADRRFRFDRISPDPGDLPNVDLPVGDDIGTCGGKMPVDACAYAVRRLPNVNRYLIQIAQRVTAHVVGERPDRETTKAQIDRHVYAACRSAPVCSVDQ